MTAYALASRVAPAGLQLGASVAVDFHPDGDFDDFGLTPDLPHRDLPISLYLRSSGFGISEAATSALSTRSGMQCKGL